MSDDLVKRLQSGIATKAQIMGGFTVDIPATQTLLAEAAAEITRLRAQVAADDCHCDGGQMTIQEEFQMLRSEVEELRAALTPKGDVRAAAKGAKAK